MMYEQDPPLRGSGASSLDVGVLIVVGPSHLEFNGTTIPGGVQYALLAASVLATSDPSVNFHFYLGVQGRKANLGLSAFPPNATISVVHFDPSSVAYVDASISSNQHGLILDHLLSVVDCRHEFLLVLDPDCFVTLEGLVTELVAKMRLDNYLLSGVPYPYFYPVDYPSDFPTLYFVLMSSDLARQRISSFLPDQSQEVFGGSDIGLPAAWLGRTTAVINRISLCEGGLDLRVPHIGRWRLLLNGLVIRLGFRGRHVGDTGYRLREIAKDELVLILPSVTVTSQITTARGRRVTTRAFKNWSRHRQVLIYEPTSRVGRRLWRMIRIDRFLVRADLSHKPASSVIDEAEVFGVESIQLALREAQLPDLSRCMLFAYNQCVAILHLGHQGKTDFETDKRRLEVLMTAMENHTQR